MTAKIVSKLDTPRTLWVSDYGFTVTSPCLCDTFPKFGDLINLNCHHPMFLDKTKPINGSTDAVEKL